MSKVAYYGAVRLLRERCSLCRRWALVVNGVLACCGEEAGEVHGTQRMTTGNHRRPRRRITEWMLELQDWRCAYCGQEFGEFVVVHGRSRILSPVWDHFVPRSYSFDDLSENGVTCCNVCNGWKSNRMFQTASEVRDFVARRWAHEGIYVEGVRVLPEAFRSDEDVAAILRTEVPTGRLVYDPSKGAVRNPKYSWRKGLRSST
jgi:5-methylcytosine-specific restriction endonuclease McrA